MQTKPGASKTTFLQDVLEGRNDPVVFAERILGLSLHEGQKRWLRETIKDGRKKNILVPANQFGKTMVCAVKHLWHCYYKIKLTGDPVHIKQAEYFTLNISPVSAQAKTMYAYTQQIIRGDFYWVGEDGKSHVNDCKIKDFIKQKIENPVPIIKYRNGSQTQFRSVHDDKARGLAGSQYAYISYDECPSSYNLKEELGANILSRLIKYNGDLDLVGTPASTSNSNQYYLHLVKKAAKEEDGWYVQFGKLDDNVFIPKKNRDDMKKAIYQTDKNEYRQVVLGEFITGGARYFTPEQIEGFFSEKLVYEEPKPEAHYILSCDWAVAGNDYTVMLIVDYSRKPFRVVHITRFKGIDYAPEEQYAIARSLQSKYNAEFITDATGLGGAIVATQLSDIVTSAFKFDRSLKDEMLLALKEALAAGDVVCPYNPDLEEELSVYRQEDKKITQDMVMALGMAMWYIKENYGAEQNSFDINIFTKN